MTGSPSAGSSAATDTAASSGASNRTSRSAIPTALGELGVLLEPTSVLAKAWDQVDRISQRAFFLRGRALVTGAGPIGLLACLLGVQRGYEVHVVDLATEGPKRDLVEALGAHYHAGDAADLDADVEVVIECTGLGAVGRSAAQRVVSGGIMCLTGIMNVEPQFDVDATTMNRNDGAAQPGAVRHRERRAAPLGAGRRRARDCRSGLVAGDDHPARATHSLERGAGTPAATTSKSSSISRHDRFERGSVVGDAGAAQRGAAVARGAPGAAVGRHPRPTHTPRHARRRRQPRRGGHDLARPARRRGRARSGRRIRRGCRAGVPVRRRGRIGAGAGPARGRPDRRADERRSVRPAGAVLGRDDGLRRVARRRRALPPRARRQLHHRAHRPDDRQRDRVEPRRQHDVPERQRHRLPRDVPLR